MKYDFQLSFRPGHGREIALVTLLDDFWWGQNPFLHPSLLYLTSQQLSMPLTMVSFGSAPQVGIECLGWEWAGLY